MAVNGLSDIRASVEAERPGPATKAAKQDAAGLRQACQQFEAVLLAQLLRKMRDTVPKDGLFGRSNTQEIYNGMLDWEMAQQMARTQSVGLADMLYRQLGGLEADSSDNRPVNATAAVSPGVAPAVDSGGDGDE